MEICESWDVIPLELREAPNWVGVEYRRDADNKLGKVPVDVQFAVVGFRSYRASVSDPTTWCTFDTALEAWADGRIEGIMVRLPKDVVMIDFDKMKNIRSNRDVDSMLRQCASFGEYSPSGNGFHILGKVYQPITTQYRELFSDGLVEIFTERFCTITGDIHPDSKNQLTDLTSFLGRQFPGLYNAPPKEPVITAVAGISDLDDAAVIRCALAARNSGEFAALHAGRFVEVNPTWSHSEADIAYVSHLVYWTNGDVQQIDRLFRASALYRKKWDKVGYRQLTMNKALRRVTERFKPGETKESEADVYKRIYKGRHR